MKIEYLNEFVKVAKYLNFSKTAEMCYISQPVLTRHIAQVEEEFGVRLLKRDTQSVELTEAGRIFLMHVIPILRSYDDLKKEMKDLKNGFEGILRIAIPFYGAEEYLHNIPQYFEEKNPSIKLEYKVGGMNEVLSYLYEDRVDVAIAPNCSYPEGGTLKFFKMFEEPLGVLVSTQNKLSEKKECSLAELKKEVFFGVENDYSNSTFELTKELCQWSGFDPTGPVLFNSSETAIMAVRRNEGVFIVGEHMKIHASSKLAFLKLTDSFCYRDVGLWRKRERVNGITNDFIRLALEKYNE